MNSFAKVELLKDAWALFRKNLNLFALLIGVYLIYYIVQYAIQGALRYNVASGLVSLVFSAISLVLELGSINLVLRLIDGKKAEIANLYNYPDLAMKALKCFVASILFGIMFVVGLILLVIPGIYLAIRMQFFTYYIVDKDAGVVDSLKMSWNLTKNGVLNLFLFDVLLILLNCLGAILFGIGLLITVPLSLIAVSLLYRKFQS